MTSPYLLRPLRSLAEVSREAPAKGSAGKTPAGEKVVSTPDLHVFLRSFIARYPASSPASSEVRPEFAESTPLAGPTPLAEIHAVSDSTKPARAKPARLVWTNDTQPVRTRRRGWRPRLERSEG